jgi:hypothetical protein
VRGNQSSACKNVEKMNNFRIIHLMNDKIRIVAWKLDTFTKGRYYLGVKWIPEEVL